MRIGLFLLLLWALPGQAQKTLKGQVLDDKGKPVPDASVFLSNTSIGTKANDKGNFELYIPAGRHELIVSSVGYQIYSQTVNPADLADVITIRLLVKADELETVVIEPYEKNGWQTWGKFFLESFIGTSAESAECTIKNTGTIRFRHSRARNELTAYALEPLLIENKALGYVIHYQLEEFSYDFKNNYLIYTGYPFFEEMKGGAARRKRWEKARREVYEGSMMHFMRALYINHVAEEGFEMHRLKKFENTEKKRVRQLYAGQRGAIQLAKDSSDYYQKVLKQSDVFDVASSTLLSGDSVAYAVNKVTAGLDFPDYLLITYKLKMAPTAYSRRSNEGSTAMMSQITLVHGRPVEIESNGSYYNPEDLMSLGFWAWSEKIGRMLPFDYKK